MEPALFYQTSNIPPQGAIINGDDTMYKDKITSYMKQSLDPPPTNKIKQAHRYS